MKHYTPETLTHMLGYNRSTAGYKFDNPPIVININAN